MTHRVKVALFVTCLVDQLFPEIGKATVRLLRQAGCDVEFPATQTCCGQPFYNSGFTNEAAHLARNTITILEPYSRIIIPSGSCTAMIGHEYAQLFAEDPAWLRRAQALAAKTMELSDFLMEQGMAFPQPTRTTVGPTVTYHDSCHMSRLLHIRDAPRKLLQKAGYSVKEMDESDRCCGFGGLFSIRMAEISNQMTAVKLQLAGKSGSKTVVTADPGCLLQMRGLVRDEIEIVHLATALTEGITTGEEKERKPGQAND